MHCCAPDVPVQLIRAAGATSISLDLTAVGTGADDALGEFVESGGGLLLGVVPSTDTASDGQELSDPMTTVSPVRQLWQRLGLVPETLGNVVVTPTCGLARASPRHARAAMSRCREAARSLVDDPEVTVPEEPGDRRPG